MDNEIDIRELISVLLKRWWLFVTIPVIAAGAAFYISFYVMQPVYQSSTTLYVINKEAVEQAVIAYSDLITGQQLVNDYRELIKSRRITNAVISELGLEGMTAGSLAGKLNIQSKNDTRIMEIFVRYKDPHKAAEIADKVAEVFINEAVNLMKIDNIEVIDYAEVPSVPIEPKTELNTIIAFVLGLIVACGIALLIEFFDDRIKTSDDVEKYLGLAVLGTIPEFKIE